MSLPNPNSDAPPPIPYTTPPALIAFTLAVLVLCFVGFCLIYLCRYCFVSILHTWAFQRTASGTLERLSPNASPFRGIDPSLLQAFPTFAYASVKDLRKGHKCILECAICLLEFEDDSMLRLLTVCCHVFHQECIDLWLGSHKTCPVCRTDLDSPTYQLQKSQDLAAGDNQRESRVSLTGDDDIRIDVKEGEGDVAGGERHERDHPVSVSLMSVQLQQEEQRFARSHSTGHSIIMIRGGDEEKGYDKYTLRLPEHVEVNFIRGGHNCTRSYASYEDMTRSTATCSNCGFVQTVPGSTSRFDTEKT